MLCGHSFTLAEVNNYQFRENTAIPVLGNRALSNLCGASVPYVQLNKEFTPLSLEVPVGEFAAYLFDCDGTVADSMPLHYVAWVSALAAWNCDFPEKLFYDWGGLPVAEIVMLLNKNARIAVVSLRSMNVS